MAQIDRVRNDAWELSLKGYTVHEVCGPFHNCASPGKVPHTKGWNEGGVKDRFWVESAFKRRATSNLGVLCVPELLVLDCDNHFEGADGLAELRELYAHHGFMQPRVTYVTGSGGAHIWLRVPVEEGWQLACNRKLLPNVDTRTGGLNKHGLEPKVGQVIVPPSIHECGKRYVWQNWHKPPKLADLPVAPNFILEKLKWSPPRKQAAETTGQYKLGDSVGGFDQMSERYWERALDSMRKLPPGGGGARSRNTTLYALGATARALFNTSERTVPGQGRMMQDAIAAAEQAGLEDDLERQFLNGWDAASSEDIQLPLGLVENLNNARSDLIYAIRVSGV